MTQCIIASGVLIIIATTISLKRKFRFRDFFIFSTERFTSVFLREKYINK